MSTIIDIDDNTLIQSPYLSLLAAGSSGQDGSAYGIHLRWLLRGILGDMHLPKGDYCSQNNNNFNKENDYVTIYRTPYNGRQTRILFDNTVPQSVDNNKRIWIYPLNGDRFFYLKFIDIEKYTETVNEGYTPFVNPGLFIQHYCSLNGTIEIESPEHLFFGFFFVAQSFFNPDTGSNANNYWLKTEVLSVNENRLSAPKFVYSRKNYSKDTLRDILLFCENGRSFRFQADSCYVREIGFVFYDTFIEEVNSAASSSMSWEKLGEFALSTNDSEVFERLEPQYNLVHGSWPRFNDGACVNVNNYKDKWNGTSDNVHDKNIKEVVSDYLLLSEEVDNPGGNENIFLGSTEEDGSPMTMSFLDALNVGAMDFHVARMLGLGAIDMYVGGQLYVYAAEYRTLRNLEDLTEFKETKHLYLSLPTSVNTERLPLAVDINEIVPGIVNKNGGGKEILGFTSDEGYTSDGRYRFVTVLVNKEEEDIPNPPFYVTGKEFDRSEFTFPLFGGLEHKKNNAPEWEKPELSNNPDYQNEMVCCNETIPLLFSRALPDRGGKRILYVHMQQDSGEHTYSSYGINIFSRSTRGSGLYSVETRLKASLLNPPVNINAVLVREEIPLFLTSLQDQHRYNLIPEGVDKTLIRLTFDYHTQNELSVYKIDESYSRLTDDEILNDESIFPDDFEIYAEEVEIFFRNKTVPRSVSGKVTAVFDDSLDPSISVITTDKYPLASLGDEKYVIPELPVSERINYEGGVLTIGEQTFIVHSVNPNSPVDRPEIRVYKKAVGDTLFFDEDADHLQAPEPGNLFTIIENMQKPSNWGVCNPHSLKVEIGPRTPEWTVRREIFHKKNMDDVYERYLEKSRGFWEHAEIERVEEPVDHVLDNAGNVIDVIYEFRGLHKVTVSNFYLPPHNQSNADGVSVEWHNGIVRLKREAAAEENGERNLFEVLRMEDSGSNLVLYINDSLYDEDRPYDAIQTGWQFVNYYPGYKVYLYADETKNLTETNILPGRGEGVRYSVFGLRSCNPDCTSRISTPVLMFAQEWIEPEAPLLPKGADYATRPDFFGKASYTLTPIFSEKPDSILFYRSNDEAFLNALYEEGTIKQIRSELECLGGNDEVYFGNRWRNFLDFEILSQVGRYDVFPPEEKGYAFPMPDNTLFIEAINEFVSWNNKEYEENAPSVTEITSLSSVIIPATQKHAQLRVIDFIRQTIYNAFTPLTEMPVVYQYIKPNIFHPDPYFPLPKKQNIKDRNGYVLPPGDPEFDMAPMAKIADDNPLKVVFTDFTLDGTSRNVYFYGAKGMNIHMKTSDFNNFLGPIKLVDANPPEAPEIKKMIPVLPNAALGINPSVCFEINAYPQNQYIRKIALYRALDKLDAQSIRTMTKVKEIDIEQSEMLQDTVWSFYDDFTDLAEIPYGEPLCYRITVSRKVEYAEYTEGNMTTGTVVTEYAPSRPSKIMATIMPETFNPESPVLGYTSESPDINGVFRNVILSWNKTVRKGKYHVCLLNSKGNWTKIKEVNSNHDETLYLPLSDTDLGYDALPTFDEEGRHIYHHFKVIAENSTGMFSTGENILTIPAIGEGVAGIGEMIIKMNLERDTFIVR